MSVFSIAGGNPALPTYPLQRSVRLRSSASAYFNRTPASSGNRQTWTWSAWVKRGSLGSDQFLMSAGTTSIGVFGFLAADTFFFNFEYTANAYITTQVFRDPSAWYHIVVVADSTNATAANRTRLYINGVQVTAFSATSYPTQNNLGYININQLHTICRRSDTATNYFDGYLTEVNFIDGQALTPSSFGAYNSYGVWSPAKYTGTYGTNGFYLNFQDNSSVTTTANVGIGKDSSGQGNYWTSNGINVSPYTGTPPVNNSYDSMVDVPTNTSSTNANFPTLNPLAGFVTGGVSVSDANLNTVLNRTTYNNWVPATFALPTSGKYYFEVQQTAQTGGPGPGLNIGLMNAATPSTTQIPANYRSVYLISGNKVSEAGSVAYGSAYVLNDIVLIAIDMDNGKIWFGKNGTWFASGDPAAGTNAAYTDIISSGYTWYPAILNIASNTTNTANINFGQRPFSYTPPTGFNRLNTYNLPDSIVPVGNKYFDINLSAATGATRAVTGFNFQPDMVWSKNRTYATNGRWGQIDSVRGVNNTLSSNLSNAEVTSQTDLLTAFNTNGFTLGADAAAYGWNYNQGGNSLYAYFAWRSSNASAVTNTSGTITSQVSANQTAGFSIVTYTGNGTNPGATIGHGLNTAPKLIIAKSRAAGEWPSYHASLSVTNTIYLNANYASTTYVNRYSAVSNTTFTTGSSGSELNTNAVNYVAYCFTEIPGYSKFSSYTGNGTTSNFVYLGFRPRFIMVKRTDVADDWVIVNSSMAGYNGNTGELYPDLANSEGIAPGTRCDLLSNGFRVLASNAYWNASNGNYVYAAFAENPFKNALAR